MIRFTCPNCQSSLDAKEKLAGQSRKCPKCGASVQIPDAAAPSDDAGDPTPKIEVIEEGLPRFQGPKHLVRTNRYLICDRTSVLAVWVDGSGWMLKTNTGLISAPRNPELLPSEGSFVLVELKLARTDQGLHLAGVQCHQLAKRWALKALEEGEDKILGKITGPGSLNRDQKLAVLHFLKESFMPDVWEHSEKARDFLTNVDYASSGTE